MSIDNTGDNGGLSLPRQTGPPASQIIKRARAYMLKLPLAVSGQNGHGATFHVACVLVHGFDLPVGEAMMLMREYNDRLHEKWSERELQHKVDDADGADSVRPRGYLIRGSEPWRLPDSRDFVCKPTKQVSRIIPLTAKHPDSLRSPTCSHELGKPSPNG